MPHIINHVILRKEVGMNEVRQTATTQKITDSKVLSHKKVLMERERNHDERKRRRIMNISVPFFRLTWHKSRESGERGKNLVRRLEW